MNKTITWAGLSFILLEAFALLFMVIGGLVEQATTQGLIVFGLIFFNLLAMALIVIGACMRE